MSALTNREAVAAVCNGRHFFMSREIIKSGEPIKIWLCSQCGASRDFGTDEIELPA